MKIRERAADILLRWSRSPLTIDKFVERESEDLGVRERALLEELCFGSMRRRLTLDFLIKRGLGPLSVLWNLSRKKIETSCSDSDF